MSIATPSDFEIAPARPGLLPFASAAACVALADWLFYGWRIGVSLAIFFGVLGIIAVACNGVRANRQTQIVMTVVFVAGLAALAEDANVTSVTISALATALFILVVTVQETPAWPRNMIEAVVMPLRGPFQLSVDLLGLWRQLKGRSPEFLKMGSLIGWIVPLCVFAIFLSLFSSANPLIEYRLAQIDLRAFFGLFSLSRIVFWILVICFMWPLIHRRIQREPVLKAASETAAMPLLDTTVLDYLFSTQAMLRSLVLFNALFALQSGLDLAYLWGGLSLPDGMSHAEYAHRGAYPLIATALLAAGFALVAMRPGSPAQHSRLIRPLVLLWIAQNVLLVISSIFRLDLYVAAYSLTYLRVAAFVWMVLVAIGLVLMIIQIMLRKPNYWLLTTNAISLVLVLYATCFINLPLLVASYNVEHSHEMGGTGPHLDLQYLELLGPQAEPAIKPHLGEIPKLEAVISKFRQSRNDTPESTNWRAWSFRTWRLERYLSNNPDVQSNPDKTGKG